MVKVIVNTPPTAPSPPPGTTFDITGLTFEDVRALRTILQHVGGRPSGPRGSVDLINVALDTAAREAGVYKIEEYPLRRDIAAVYFA